jgi:hypothetical protein
MHVCSADLTHTPISCNLHQGKTAAQDVDFFRTSIRRYGLLDVGEVMKVACLLTTAFGSGARVGARPFDGLWSLWTSENIPATPAPNDQTVAGLASHEPWSERDGLLSVVGRGSNDPYPLASHHTRCHRRR